MVLQHTCINDVTIQDIGFGYRNALLKWGHLLVSSALLLRLFFLSAKAIVSLSKLHIEQIFDTVFLFTLFWSMIFHSMSYCLFVSFSLCMYVDKVVDCFFLSVAEALNELNTIYIYISY